MDPNRLLDGRLKLRHLVLVTTIAEHGSVMRAAEHLRVTQPVVTRGLRELEAILGVPVFDRGPRGVTPTVHGRAFVEHAEAVLARLRQAARHVTELSDGEVGTVTVGTHLAAATLLVPRAVAALKRERPRLTVIVKESTPDVLVADLHSGRIDVMVGRLTPVDDGGRTVQVRLYHEPVRLVTRAGHPAQRLDAPALADLQGFPWVFPVDQTALRQELEAVFAEAGVPLPTDRVETTSAPVLRALLRDNDVIAALPMLVAAEDDELAVLPTPLRSVHRLVGATLAQDRPLSPSAELLMEHLRRAAAGIRNDIAEQA